MKKLTENNINTADYWDNIYKNNKEVKQYEEATKGLAKSYTRFEKAISMVNKGEKVLDFGCGSGLFCRMLKEQKKDNDVVGFDISPKVIAQNKKREDGVLYEVYEIGIDMEVALEFRDYFDVIFSGETLEHVNNPANLFAEARMMLKEGGRLIVTTPFENRIGSQEHVWAFGYEDMSKLYTTNGFDTPVYHLLPPPEDQLIIFSEGEKL